MKKLILIIAILTSITAGAAYAVNKVFYDRRSLSAVDQTWAMAATMISSEEGFRPYWYTCSASKATIGYGFTTGTLKAYGYARAPLMTRKTADEILMVIVKAIDKKLDKMITVRLTTAQRAACISFCFNSGCNAFANSTLRKKLNARRPNAEIRHEFSRWNKYHDKDGVVRVSVGLTKRRAREAAAFRD